MTTPLLPNERVEKTAWASCRREKETIEGRLTCTNKRLIWEEEKPTQQGEVINLSQIERINYKWIDVGGAHACTGTQFEIQLHDMTTRSSVVRECGDWIATIDHLINEDNTK